MDVQLGRIDATSANTLPSCMSEANYFADAGVRSVGHAHAQQHHPAPLRLHLALSNL